MAPNSYHDFAAIVDAVASSDLVAWYKMNEGTGSTAYDYEQSNDATINGASWQSAGKTGDVSLNFDGTDDHAVIPHQSYLTQTNLQPWTITAWVKSGLTQDGYVILKNGSGNEEWSIRLQSDGTWIVGCENDSDDGIFVTGVGNVTANDWVHIVNWFDGSTIRAYENGTQIGSDVSFFGNMHSKTQDPWIGAHENGKVYFNGLIDDVRIYDRALSESEIQEIYDNTK